MQHRLQRTAANGKRLIGHREAMRKFASRVNVSALHALVYHDPVRQQPAQDARDARNDRLSVHICANIAYLDHVANLLDALKATCAQYPQ